MFFNSIAKIYKHLLMQIGYSCFIMITGDAVKHAVSISLHNEYSDVWSYVQIILTSESKTHYG